MNEPPTRDDILLKLRQALPCLCQEFGVQRLAIYGSFARGQATPDSDVDLLVELNQPLGERFIRLATRLEKLLGRNVDLSTFEELHRQRDHPQWGWMASEIEETLTYVDDIM